ncbi:MAG: hypothetical protein E7115_02050 [Bacteroidales bacterium]|nr:hypothetical protein [Bacteroidales bacterium]
MKKAFILAAMLICAGLNAQELEQAASQEPAQATSLEAKQNESQAVSKTEESKKSYPHQHAIEITTGYPSLVFQSEFAWINTRIEASRDGQKFKEYYQPGLNIGYTFSWGKRWELSALANVHLTIYDTLQYPEIPSTGSKKEYDKTADPTRIDRTVNVWGSISAAVRFKWIVRESFSMYSALGIGTSFHFPFPIPYVAPVGIKFGKGKVYGLAEVNVSAANTFGMVGLGVRL